MNQSGIDLLLSGHSIGGFLRLRCDEEIESVPGTIQLIDNQVVVSLIIEPMTPLAATLMPGHMLVLNGEEIVPVDYSQMATFDSRLGGATLIQLGHPEILSHTLGYPLECRLVPRFTVLAHIDEPYWRRPTVVMAEVGGLAAWMHGGRVVRSGSLNYEENADDTNRWRLTFRDFDNRVFPFDNSSSTVTISSSHEIDRPNSSDELSVRFRATATIERPNEITWTEAIDTIDAIQELINLLSWSDQKWGHLHCKFGLPTAVDNDHWNSIGTPSPPELPESWIRTLTLRSRDASEEATKRLEFVMPFNELKENSIGDWLRIRAEYGKGLRQVLQVIESPSMTPEVRALQLGAGIELLGFRSLANKTDFKKADKARAKKLFDEIAAEAVRMLPDTFGQWAETANHNYQSMKHLGRKGEVPTVGELARTNDLTVLVFQIWLAKKLGASDDNLREQIRESWRYSSDYSRVADPTEIR